MPRYLSFVLLSVILHAFLSEGKNQTCTNRGKRKIQEDLMDNAALISDVFKKELDNSFCRPEQIPKSDFYAQILKDIADLVELKKNEIKDNVYPDNDDVMFQTSADCRDCYDRGTDNDPSMTKFYTFSKMTAEEQKSLPWLDLLSSPFIQSLVRPKPTLNYPKKNIFYPNCDKLLVAEPRYNGPVVKRKEIDDESLNSLVNLFSSFGYGQSKKPNGNENVVGLTNQPSVNNEIMEDKITSSCLVDNKSNYFKTDTASPYSKYLSIRPQEPKIHGNYSRFTDRFNKDNSSDEKLGYYEEDPSKRQPTVLAEQFRNIIGLGEYKGIRWPANKMDMIAPPFNVTKKETYIENKVALGKGKAATNNNKSINPLNFLENINLDPPQYKYSDDFSRKFNATKYLTDLFKEELDARTADVNDKVDNSIRTNNVDLKHNLRFQNLIQSPDPVERIRIINNMLNPNKINAPAKSLYGIDGERMYPSVKNIADPKYIDNKCDIKTLTNILNYKINSFNDRSNNVTTSDPSDVEKWRNGAAAVANEVDPNSRANKVPPPTGAIGEEQHVPPPLDIQPPGRERIILPEYEKMDNSGQDLSRTTSKVGFTGTNGYIPVTTLAEVKSPSTESPPSLGTDTMNVLHRNMIPVIDFLGQMWNSPTRKNHFTGVTSVGRSLASDCGGYVIVPLSKESMFQNLKHSETGTTERFPPDVRSSCATTGMTNVSVSALVTPSNREMLEKFVLRRLYDSFRGYLMPRRRSRRSKTPSEVIEDNHTQEASTTPSSPLNSTQLPPTDKWIISSSEQPFSSANDSV